MAVIRHIRISNFRCIKEFSWSPSAGLNCLIGPGDSGKSTILDAIENCLSPRRYAVFSEVDFHRLDISKPIVIDVTMGGLEDHLLDLDSYAGYLRGWKGEGQIEDEPGAGMEPVLTVRMEVHDDLVPRWRLYAERAEEQGARDRDLTAKDRANIAPTRLGAFATNHLSWGQRSILNRIGDERADAGSALAMARTAAKLAFGSQVSTLFDEALTTVNQVAADLAVDIGAGAKALLDTQQMSMGSGAIALHDDKDVPLRSLGLGSSRLVVAGLQRQAGGGGIALVDEIEHGLEPYRICQLLHKLGSKEDGAPQVILFKDSPNVQRVLKVMAEAVPDAGALVLGGEAARLLGEIADGLNSRWLDISEPWLVPCLCFLRSITIARSLPDVAVLETKLGRSPLLDLLVGP